jgi:hypothetical protein
MEIKPFNPTFHQYNMLDRKIIQKISSIMNYCLIVKLLIEKDILKYIQSEGVLQINIHQIRQVLVNPITAIILYAHIALLIKISAFNVKTVHNLMISIVFAL